MEDGEGLDRVLRAARGWKVGQMQVDVKPGSTASRPQFWTIELDHEGKSM